jgi:hypothetical protein
MSRNDLLNGLKMIDSKRFTRAVLGRAAQRAQNGLRGGRQEFSEPPQTAQFRPNQREQLFLERFIAASPLAHFLLGFLQGFRHERSDDGLFGFEVVEKRAGGDSGGGSDAAGCGAVPTVSGEKPGGDFNDSFPCFRFRFGCDSHRARLINMSMLIKYSWSADLVNQKRERAHIVNWRSANLRSLDKLAAHGQENPWPLRNYWCNRRWWNG